MKTNTEIQTIETVVSSKEEQLNTFEKDLKTVKGMLANKKYLKFVSNELQKNKEVMKYILNENGSLYRYMNTENRNDAELALIAVKQNKDALDFIPKSLCNNHQFIIDLCKVTQFGLYYGSNDVKNNINTVIECIKNHPYSIMFCHYTLHENIEILELALSKNIWYAKFISKPILDKHLNYFKSKNIDYSLLP
jgi:hypothetical protein